MNRQRRKAIENIMTQIEGLQAKIEELQSEEQDAYDNLPESLQDGEMGEAMSNAIDNLDGALSSIEELLEYLEEAAQ